MTTDTLQFAYEKQLTQFFGPTEIKNDSVTINCERGSFHVQKEEGTLYKNVKISQSGQVVVCDTAYYASKPQIFTASGKVQIDDNQNNKRLLSDVFYSNKSIGKSYITGNALAIQKTENDSIYLISDTLTILEDSIGNTKAMIGNKNVKIYSNGMQSISDSAYYDNKTGQLTLSKSPIIWAKNAQLKGDTIVVFMMDSLVKKAIVSGKASAIMELDSGLYYNQLSGRKMTAWFENNELQRADMNGNAWTILYPIEELKTDSSITKKRLGLNRLYASDLRVFLDSGEVKSITYFDKPDGVFYPMNQIKEEEKFIVGFNWLVAKRPKRPKNIGRKI
jgi:lipopolysaccharide export system protein LptA